MSVSFRVLDRFCLFEDGEYYANYQELVYSIELRYSRACTPPCTGKIIVCLTVYLFFDLRAVPVPCVTDNISVSYTVRRTNAAYTLTQILVSKSWIP